MTVYLVQDSDLDIVYTYNNVVALTKEDDTVHMVQEDRDNGKIVMFSTYRNVVSCEVN